MGKIYSRKQIQKVEIDPKKVVIKYAPSQLFEIIRCHKDPQYFIDTYLKLKKTSMVSTFFSTRSYQQAQLDTMKLNSLFCLQPRGSGATSLSLAFQLWEALFRPNTYHGAAFVTSSNVDDGMKLINYWYDNLPKWLRSDIAHMSNQNLKFDNGSSITVDVIDANFNRGRKWTTLYADNFAYASNIKQEDFWLSTISSTLNGRVFISGVPNGPINTFASIWNHLTQSKNLHFLTMRVPIGNVYTQTEQDAFKLLIGDRTFRREFECEFIL